MHSSTTLTFSKVLSSLLPLNDLCLREEVVANVIRLYRSDRPSRRGGGTVYGRVGLYRLLLSSSEFSLDTIPYTFYFTILVER